MSRDRAFDASTALSTVGYEGHSRPSFSAFETAQSSRPRSSPWKCWPFQMDGMLVQAPPFRCGWLTVIPFSVSGCRSEEHTSELQSLMRISYAVFCLKKKSILNTKEIDTLQYN